MIVVSTRVAFGQVLTGSGHKRAFERDRNFYFLIWMVITQVCTYVKIHKIRALLCKYYFCKINK